jgi:two-component system, LytTR family, sensor kinase
MGSFSGIALYNNPGMKYLLQPRYKVLRHTVYIGFIVLFWVLFGWRYLTDGLWAIVQLGAYTLSYVLIIYFNFLVLMPRYLYKNRVWQFLAITYATFLIGYAIQHAIYVNSWDEFLTLFDFDGPRIRDMMINAITFILFCGVGWAFNMFKMWLTDENKIVELENEKLVAELSNLKHQLNPHFLFNVFNSLYVSSKTTPALVPEMILDLSDLMRYQLEDCTKEKVALDDEIAYIQNFIGIER